jgi:hypothetical protein
MTKRPGYRKSVFINCPFDEEFAPILQSRVAEGDARLGGGREATAGLTSKVGRLRRGAKKGSRCGFPFL